ncbi:MAG: penicillin-binding protein 2 [Fimbriimonadaceae bacterium]|jgi:penicillin-binding protein 2|nr:penicillin-binding protein 2 [Fimbriimonadaceae bacterium]
MAQVASTMSIIHTQERTPLSPRFLLVPILLVLAFVFFLFRLWFLQVARFEDLKEEASRSGVLEDRLLAPRGLIVDRNDIPLATVQPSFVAFVVPREMRRDPEILARLAGILGTEQKRLTRAMEKGQRGLDARVPVFVGIRPEIAAYLVENPEEFQGVTVESLPMRHYQDTINYSHMMGFVWVPDERTERRLKEQGIQPADYVGRDGIESLYESQLMGTPGSERVAVDARRRPIRYLGSDSPVPGQKLILSLDSRLQSYAQTLLAGRRGAIVALDPRSGEIFAIASAPTYDMAVWQGGISEEDFSRLREDPDRPLYPRAIAGAYAPGSTYKIVTSIAAKMAGKWQPSTSVFCPGYIMVGNRRVRCDNHPPAAMDFKWAMTRSCNKYFANLALQSGPEAMEKAALAVGLGSRTGVDIPGESAGIVPTILFRNRNRVWYDGNTVNMGIGQGELNTTPLQMASVISLVANRGVSYEPHVVRGFMNVTTGSVQLREKKILGKFDADPEFWRDLADSLFNVIDAGTGRRAQISGLSWGGKTGSSQNHRGRQPDSWFVGYAPLNNPEIAICVMVENGGHGGDLAAPLAGQVVRRWFSLRDEAQPADARASENLRAADLRASSL